MSRVFTRSGGGRGPSNNSGGSNIAGGTRSRGSNANSGMRTTSFSKKSVFSKQPKTINKLVQVLEISVIVTGIIKSKRTLSHLV